MLGTLCRCTSVESVFRGTICRVVDCSECGQVGMRVRTNSFRDLSLEIDNIDSVEAALQHAQMVGKAPPPYLVTA